MIEKHIVLVQDKKNPTKIKAEGREQSWVLGKAEGLVAQYGWNRGGGREQTELEADR